MVSQLRAPISSRSEAAAARAAGLRRSNWAVAGFVLVVHAVWIGAYLVAGHEIRDFIKIGYLDVQKSHVSSVITFDLAYQYPPNHDAPNGTGFDGQYYYYIALDPANARYYIDPAESAYRYTRILYPMAARVLALGQPSVIPYTMLLINWLAVGLGTLVLAAWLRRRRLSPWFAAIFGLYPGLLISLQRDLTEPLAYALVAVTIYLFDYGGKRRLLWAATAFALAGLTREVTLIFAAAYALRVLLEGDRGQVWRERLSDNWRRTLAFAGLAALPLALYEVFLLRWLGSLSAGGGVAPIPFLGLFTAGPWQLSRQPPEIVGVVIPALICAGLAVRALRRGVVRVEIIALLANVLFLVILLPDSVYTAYTSAGRAAVGVVLAALICLPYVSQLGLRTRGLVIAPAVLWLSLWPAALFYGFATNFRA